MQRISLGLPAGEALQPAPGELAWWWGYAPASLVCRVVLAVGLVAWIGAPHFWLGLVVDVSLGWRLVALPPLARVPVPYTTMEPLRDVPMLGRA